MVGTTATAWSLARTAALICVKSFYTTWTVSRGTCGLTRSFSRH